MSDKKLAAYLAFHRLSQTYTSPLANFQTSFQIVQVFIIALRVYTIKLLMCLSTTFYAPRKRIYAHYSSSEHCNGTNTC